MPLSLVERLLAQAGRDRVAREVHFHVMGEPLLYPSLTEAVRLARGSGLEAWMTTNGSLLTPDLLTDLRDAGLSHLTISLQTPDAPHLRPAWVPSPLLCGVPGADRRRGAQVSGGRVGDAPLDLLSVQSAAPVPRPGRGPDARGRVREGAARAHGALGGRDLRRHGVRAAGARPPRSDPEGRHLEGRLHPPDGTPGLPGPRPGELGGALRRPYRARPIRLLPGSGGAVRGPVERGLRDLLRGLRRTDGAGERLGDVAGAVSVAPRGAGDRRGLPTASRHPPALPAVPRGSAPGERLPAAGRIDRLFQGLSEVHEGRNRGTRRGMNLLLISPLTSKSLLGADFYFRMPTLGLLRVAGATPPEWTVTILDEKAEPIDFSRPADLVGITGMTPAINRAYEIADKFRAAACPWSWGGSTSA